ncbi:MAG: GntR family transcriptional regulator [Victivallaceae bacterium]|nr:GntR family transcriptional regulator [Victivallaceae bacterium]
MKLALKEPLRNNNVLLHIQIKQKLLDEFRRGKIKPGDPFPSVRELTRRFGTTIVTIDKTIKELKRDGIVHSYPRKGALWGKKNNFAHYRTIGIHVPVLGEISPERAPYYYAVIEGIRNSLSSEGFCIKLLRTSVVGDDDSLNNICCDGIICTGSDMEIMTAVNRFKKLNLPYLLLDRPREDNTLNYLERDSEKNLYDMTKFLIARGYKSIGFIDIDSKLWIFEKIRKGYIKAMNETGLDCSERIFKLTPDENSYFKEPDNDKFLDFCKMQTALIIGTHYKYLIDYVTGFLTKNGMDVPGKCAVLSLSNTEELSSNGIPVSCFPVTPYRMGVKAGEGIVKLLENETPKPLNIEFKTDIKWRY